MNSMCLLPPAISSWPIWVLNCHTLAIKSGHFLDDKWACGLCIQPLKLPLAPDDQLAWLKIKQGRGIHLGTLIPPGELLDSMLSIPNVVSPQLLKLHNNVANFGKVGFLFICSQLFGQ